MYPAFYPESAFTSLEGAAAGRRTSSSQGSALDIKRLEGNLLLSLSAATVSGTNPTLDVTVEERVDASDSWAPVPDHAWFDPADNSDGAGAKFDQVTNAAASYQVRGLKRQYLKAQIRVKWTIGGTSTPTVDFAVNVIGFDRYEDR
jgi:hypothetical protein